MAEGAGIHLRVIDAVHLLAALAHQRGHPAMAARLFAAVATERAASATCLELPIPTTSSASRSSRTQHPNLGARRYTHAHRRRRYARRSRGERNRAKIGWDSLTPTEQRVLDALIDGHSNEEIASRLLMSPATVKTHLTHIYAKTDTANRGQLVTRYLQQSSRYPNATTS